MMELKQETRPEARPEEGNETRPKWYENIGLEDAETFIAANLKSAARSVIAIGYYLKYIRDQELYREAGYENIWDYARNRYGFSVSTASRYMARNDKFSVGGNSPTLDEKYRDYSKSQLQEMLSLNEEQLEQVRPDMTVQEIRGMRRPKEVPYFPLEGQQEMEKDYPQVIPEEHMTLQLSDFGTCSRQEPDQPTARESITVDMDVSELVGADEAEEEQGAVATSQEEERQLPAMAGTAPVNYEPERCDNQEQLEGICEGCRLNEYACGILNTYRELQHENSDCSEGRDNNMSLYEIVFLYFGGDYEKMITCLEEIGELTGISMHPVISQLDKITHEDY